jgi:hypothetical protein
MKKTSLLKTLFLAVVIVAAGIGTTQKAAAQTTNYDISAGNVTITTDGDYYIIGTTTSNCIVVQSGLTAVNITLDGVDIDVSGISRYERRDGQPDLGGHKHAEQRISPCGNQCT